MFEPSFEQNFMALLGIPLAVWITALGTGLAIERVTRAELANALLLPLGLTGSICLVYPLYALHLSDVLPVVLLVLVTVGGLIWARGGVRSRLNPGLPGLAGLAVYVLFMLPVIVEGHWLWLGYNFDNDTSVQLLITAALKAHGTQMLSSAATGGRVVDTYFATGYPIGAHALLATLSGLLHSDPAVVYQGFLSSLSATIALTVAAASARAIGARRAAMLGLAAAAANLFFQYAYQGTIKEIATATATIAAFAIATEAIRARRAYSGVAVAAVPLAAILCTYGVAGGPYVLAAIGAVVVQLVVVERRLPRPFWLAPGLLGGALIIALSIPAVIEFNTLFNIAKAVVGRASPVGGAVSTLGTLERALPLSQISGVWLDGDFRVPVVAEPAAALTALASALILLLLIPGVLSSLRRREAAPFLAVVTTGLVLLIVEPRVTPYAAGKLFAMASPVVVWVAGIGLFALTWRRLRWPTIAVGLALTLAILVSDMLAYHEDQISPTNRMLAMEAVGDYFAGRGPVLFNESDEFIKYFARAAEVNPAFDSLTPRQAILISPSNTFNEYFDLDQETLPYVESWPVIVTRRSPVASRPPANYKLVYTSEFYDGWERQATPNVLAQLPLQSEWSATAIPTCSAIGSLTNGAPRGSELVQALVPPSTGFAILYAKERPFSWGYQSDPPNTVTPIGPGFIEQSVDVHVAGTYQAWVQGSFPRPLEVLVDGRTIGTVDGMDSIGQWTQAATIRLTVGRHELAISRGGGRLFPGDGSRNSWIGYVTLREVGPEVLHTVPLAQWRSLCGHAADWIELVRP
ncbi:MAG: hypothetical protein ABR946_04800 [Solirubrobacteraceae bacterium]|jgi:hypothetical protein